MPEVFAWPEATLYFGSAGEVPAAMAYIENVRVEAQYEWGRYKKLVTGSWADRIVYLARDRRITMSFGAMWSDSTALLRANSASAWNMALSASAYGQTGAMQIWSAVFTQFELAGQANGMYKIQGQLEAANYSAI